MAHRWLKFWPQDWENDPCLKVCSLGARGLWIAMISIMHRSEPYGFLLVNGKSPDAKRLAAVVGCTTEKEVGSLLCELESEGVFSRAADGTIFSRRMRRDCETSQAGRDAIAKRWDNGTKPLKGNDRYPTDPPNRVPDSLYSEAEAEAEAEKEKPLRGQKKSPVTRLRTTIDPAWKPDSAGQKFAEDRGIGPPELPKFLDYHLAKGSLMADWNAAWRTWCTNAVKFGNATPLLDSGYTPTPMTGGF